MRQIAIFLLLLSLGCSRAEDSDKAQPYIDNTPLTAAGEAVKAEHPEWRNTICNKIADQQVSILMDREQVRAAWGEPWKVIVVKRPGVNQEIWIWPGDPLYPRKVVFELKSAMEIYEPQ